MTMIRHYALAFLLIFVSESTTWRLKHKCPIGFNIAYTKIKADDPMCYKIKGPEPFKDKFKDCAGNLYRSKLHYKLNITETNLVVWTDYKSQYVGGPFYDWSLSESTGDILEAASDVKVDSNLLDDELCLVLDPVTNLTATKCAEMHYRYCFVKPYVEEEDMSDEECDEEGYKRFWSPRPTCLQVLKGIGGGAVRANWKTAKELCRRRGGSLLNKGWRYANHPMFSISVAEPTFPLGVVLSPDNTTIKYDTVSDDSLIPNSEWHFDSSSITNDTSVGALHDDFWYLVNGSYVFFDVICERTLELRTVTMNLTFNQKSFILTLNDTKDMSEKDILCFSDSETYYPKKVKVRFDDVNNYYVLKPLSDGYYKCTHKNTRRFHVTESNQVLYVKDKEALVNYYAVKIRLPSNYTVSLEDSLKYWSNALEEFIYYRTNYVQVFGDAMILDPVTMERVLKEFKATHPALKFYEREVIHKVKVKRYAEGSMVLLHIQLRPNMMPVPPGKWGNLEVESMKPVYYCKGLDSVPMLPLGASTTASNCRTYTCIGDFTEGVQWVTTAASDCSRPPGKLNVEFELELPMPTVVPREESSLLETLGPGINIEDDDSDSSSPEGPSKPIQKPPPPTPNPPSSPDSKNTDLPSSESSTDASSTEASSTEASSSPMVPNLNEPDLPSENVSTAFPVTETVIVVTTLDLSDLTSSTTPMTTTSLPPEEKIQQVIDELETLLNNETAKITMDNVDNTFNQVDNILEDPENVEIPGNFLQLLDKLGTRVNLNGSRQATAIRNNVAILMADAEPSAPVRGLRLAARDGDFFTNDAFEIISQQVNNTHLTTNENEVVVHLPESVAVSSRRISFVVFRNDRAFHSLNGQYFVNSRVLSIKVENVTHFNKGEVIDIHLSPVMDVVERNQSRSCAYWHFNDDDTGYWSQEGCTFIRSTQEGVLDTCRCDHLTHFAEVLVPRAVFSETHENVLEILTIIGCCLSIFGLCMVGITAAMFRSWRRDYSNKVWLHLCVAIFILVLCFLIVILAHLETSNISCILLGVVLHYSVLASFCWMLVAAVLSYRRLVIVFSRDASHKLLRASAFAWGVPCLIVGILLSADPHSYAGRFEEKSPSGAFCYPSGLGLWLAVYAPIAVMLIANWSLFVLIVRSVFASRRIQRHGDSNEALRCASVSCLLVFLFGLPWVFGLFAYNIVAAYIFTLTATFQGFVLFVFFVVGNKKTRDLWLNQLKIKQTRKIPVTTSTYTNRSIRGEADGVAAAERNSSKPRSLAYPDNARFS